MYSNIHIFICMYIYIFINRPVLCGFVLHACWSSRYGTRFPGRSSQFVRLKQCFGRCVARLRKIVRTLFGVHHEVAIFRPFFLMFASCNVFFLFQNSWRRQDPETMHVLLTAMCRLIAATGFSVHFGWGVTQFPGVLEYGLSEEWVMVPMWLYDGSSSSL